MDMRRQVRSKRERERRTSLVLMAVAAVVLFAGLFAQISIRTRISGQAKQISAVRQEIQALSANAENLSLCINQYHNLDDISARAQSLGMALPTDDQLRVVRLPLAVEDTSAQTVLNAQDGEEIG